MCPRLLAPPCRTSQATPCTRPDLRIRVDLSDPAGAGLQIWIDLDAVTRIYVMDINMTAEYSATPDRVIEMMSDPDWWTDVYHRNNATVSNAQRTGDDVSLDVATPTPSQAQKFIGETLQMHHDLVWDAPASDGSRTATMTMKRAGVPAKAEGRMHVAAGGPGTIVTCNGSFSISIPLAGKKLEKKAAPYATAAFRTQQEAGDAWLASH